MNYARARSQYFNENFYCKNCLRVFSAMTGKPVLELLLKGEAVWVFYICFISGPTAFAAHGIGQGKKITSYPAVKDKFAGSHNFVGLVDVS